MTATATTGNESPSKNKLHNSNNANRSLSEHEDIVASKRQKLSESIEISEPMTDSVR